MLKTGCILSKQRVGSPDFSYFRFINYSEETGDYFLDCLCKKVHDTHYIGLDTRISGAYIGYIHLPFYHLYDAPSHFVSEPITVEQFKLMKQALKGLFDE
jgi:hypothetical protein